MDIIRPFTIKSKYQHVECGECGARILVDTDAGEDAEFNNPDNHEDDCTTPKGARTEETKTYTAAKVAEQARSFETDFDAQVERLKASAQKIERVRMLFRSVQMNCHHATSGRGDGETRHMIRAALCVGKLAEIFQGMKREGWVDRSHALCRVIENVVTGEDRPI